jgi:hypothetical protein
MTSWYIDAWAVRDGAAFASRRQPNSREAENTVFIAVPDLEPVPVGRLSTALSATRRCFQAGLWDQNENEIAFETIEQIIELVRRGFLAGGLGPGGAAAPAPGVRPGFTGGSDSGPPPEGGAGGAKHYEDAISSANAEGWHWKEAGSDIRSALAHLAEVATSQDDEFPALSSATRNLLKLCYSYAEAITIDWESRTLHSADPSDTKMLLAWYKALVELGVWPGEEELSNFVTKHSCWAGINLTFAWFKNTRFTWPNVGDSLPQELLSYAPCPRRGTWIDGLTRFSDKVMLPMCVADYFEVNHDLPELAPAVLGAMLVDSARFPARLLTGDRFTNARLGSALHWLLHEIPHINLPATVEQMVTDYAWGRFETRVAAAR